MFSRRKLKLRAAILLATPLTCLAPLAALAQPGQVEEIMVTAERRETNLQETPMSVAGVHCRGPGVKWS